MKFGINAFGLSPRHLPDVAALAEEHGFDSIWVPEHLVFPVEIPPAYLYSVDGFPPMRSDSPAYDPWILLATVAARTSKIRLGTNVYILPLRHPIAVARSVVTLDRVSGGRVNFGVGVGWMREEYEAVGQDFTNRGSRADEIIPLLRRLWSEDVIEHHGAHYDIPPVTFEPKPLQKPSIPIYVGGTSPAALRRAALLGDGWMAHRSNISFGEGSSKASADDYLELAQQIVTLERHRADAGRSDVPFDIRAFAGDLDDIRQCADIGVTSINAGPDSKAKATKDYFTDWVKRYADEVIARV
jgi:probable F420-dependent oxidoreductase